MTIVVWVGGCKHKIYNMTTVVWVGGCKHKIYNMTIVVWVGGCKHKIYNMTTVVWVGGCKHKIYNMTIVVWVGGCKHKIYNMIIVVILLILYVHTPSNFKMCNMTKMYNMRVKSLTMQLPLPNFAQTYVTFFLRFLTCCYTFTHLN